MLLCGFFKFHLTSTSLSSSLFFFLIYTTGLNFVVQLLILKINQFLYFSTIVLHLLILSGESLRSFSFIYSFLLSLFSSAYICTLTDFCKLNSIYVPFFFLLYNKLLALLKLVFKLLF